LCIVSPWLGRQFPAPGPQALRDWVANLLLPGWQRTPLDLLRVQYSGRPASYIRPAWFRFHKMGRVRSALFGCQTDQGIDAPSAEERKARIDTIHVQADPRGESCLVQL